MGTRPQLQQLHCRGPSAYTQHQFDSSVPLYPHLIR